MSGYEIVSIETPFEDTNASTADAVCPTGKVAVGGGFIADPNNLQLGVISNYPADSQTWRVRLNRLTGTGSWSMFVYAVCVATP